MHEDRAGRGILSSMLIEKFVRVSTAPMIQWGKCWSLYRHSVPLKMFNPQNIKMVLVACTERQSQDCLWEIPADHRLSLWIYPIQVRAFLKRRMTILFMHWDTVISTWPFSVPWPISSPTRSMGQFLFWELLLISRNRFIAALSLREQPFRVAAVWHERKGFAFAALESTSGNLIPRLVLAEEGIHLKELRSYHNFNSHESVIKWVLKGKYDAGAVRESVVQKYLPRD